MLQNGVKGTGPVIYWLNREQRYADNWALLHAQDLALRDMRGLVVVFCLQDDFLGGAKRHFRFMLKGLQELESRLQEANIQFILLRGAPERMLPLIIARLEAHSVVTDFNPLRIKKDWQQGVMAEIRVPVYEVDGHNIVPCWHVSDKREYAAYTFRPKVTRMLPEFLTDFPLVEVHQYSAGDIGTTSDWGKLLRLFSTEGVEGSTWPIAGESQGRRQLEAFITERLESYHAMRNDPLEPGQSGLSPYFHFGQLAPQRAVLSVTAAHATEENKEAYLEELIVRRELSDNYCYYCDDYDRFEGFPEWARKSLDEHRKDRREYIYTEEQFMLGLTHEALWNCCQQMLVRDGRLHGYLRMYWAKKILEWSESPEEALRIGILLNDTLAFDGRDPNGYAGVAWSIGGVHDRAWTERPVFGKIRFMNEKGCRRKFSVHDLIAACAQ
jgi:deoxyribodipyrimidine photo-lyase